MGAQTVVALRGGRWHIGTKNCIVKEHIGRLSPLWLVELGLRLYNAGIEIRYTEGFLLKNKKYNIFPGRRNSKYYQIK
jgi:hypothetical protein